MAFREWVEVMHAAKQIEYSAGDRVREVGGEGGEKRRKSILKGELLGESKGFAVGSKEDGMYRPLIVCFVIHDNFLCPYIIPTQVHYPNSSTLSPSSCHTAFFILHCPNSSLLRNTRQLSLPPHCPNPLFVPRLNSAHKKACKLKMYLAYFLILHFDGNPSSCQERRDFQFHTLLPVVWWRLRMHGSEGVNLLRKLNELP